MDPNDIKELTESTELATNSSKASDHAATENARQPSTVRVRGTSRDFYKESNRESDKFVANPSVPERDLETKPTREV